MYNPITAAQLIAYLALKTEDKTINVLKAIKLVYLVDRESIKQWGVPILDENRYSMPHGPVNSSTYSHINGERDLDSCGWSDFLEDRAHHMIAVKDGISVEDFDELSDADIQCLDAVWAEFGAMGEFELRDWTHNDDNIPEWEDPNGSSVIIPLERIMKFVGVENPESQIKLLQDHSDVERLLQELA